MKILGVGPKIGKPSFAYMLLMIIIDYFTKPLFTITSEHYSILVYIGIILILFGIGMVAIAARQLIPTFNAGKLMTTGLYSIFRNPLYAAYLIFVIPGICLILNSWLVFTSLIVYYYFFHLYIKEEYNFLHEKFGDEYTNYLEHVKFKFI